MNAEQNAAERFILLVPAQHLALPFCKSFKHAELAMSLNIPCQ